MSTVITPQSVVSMVVNPNGSQDMVFVLPGGTVRFATESPAFPTFEIKFEAPSPAANGSTLTGTINDPAVVVFNTVENTYHYKIVYHKTDGEKKTSGPFAVRSCRVCGG
jgi:hypothetical protein